MQTPKNVADRAEKSMGLITAVFVRRNGEHRNTALCGTVDDSVYGIMNQLRAESSECKTFRELFDRLPWGKPC